MSRLVQALVEEQNITRTTNGAKAFNSTLIHCLDFFFAAGASRNKSEHEIIAIFSQAYHEDKNLALQILAYARDPRGGMGERRLFRVILKHLVTSGESTFVLPYIAELGRWDDLLFLYGLDKKLDLKILELIKKTLNE